MRQGFHRLLSVSPADGQAIHEQARSALRQSTFWWGHEHLLASSSPLNSHPATLGMYQSTGLIHAMRLTSNSLSLQSP